MSEFLGQIAPLVEQMEIKTPIEVVVEPGPIASLHEADRGVSKIRLHPGVRPEDIETFNPARPFLGNLVHELCHLYLAEKVDPSFSGMNRNGTPEQEKWFELFENYTVDIWVNDLFSDRFPELFEQHYQAWTDTAVDFIGKRQWQRMLPPVIPFNVAKSMAEADRHGLPQTDFAEVLKRAGFMNKKVGSAAGQALAKTSLGDIVTRNQLRTIDKFWDELRKSQGETEPRTIQDIGTFRDFFREVPLLPEAGTEAVALHEQQLNKCFTLGKFAIRATAQPAEPRVMWALSEPTE